MASLWRRLPWGIALVAFLMGICGALIRGFWGVSQDCHSWVDTHGYQLVQNDWWAKDRGCVARLNVISRYPRPGRRSRLMKIGPGSPRRRR
jgi:hypothetical protein